MTRFLSDWKSLWRMGTATAFLSSFALAASLGAQPVLQSAHQQQMEQFGQEKAALEIPAAPKINQTSANRMAAAGNVMFGYHPYWQDGDEDQYRWDLLTHIAYFSVAINNDGTISDPNGWKSRTAWNNIKTYAQQFDTQTILCATKFGDSDIATFLSDSTARTNAANNLLAEVQAGGAEGINIDFEFVPTGSRDDFTLFMDELETVFHAADPDYHISIAAYANPSSRLDELALSEICDHLFMMNYNFHYSGGNPGPVSTMEESDIWGGGSILDTIRTHIRDGIDPSKLVAGIAWYGYEWESDGSAPGASQVSNGGAKFYQDFLTTEWPSHGKTWHWPSDDPYYAVDLGGGVWDQGWCSDHVSWKLRCQMVRETGIAGVGVWALGYASETDAMYPRLWQGLQEAYDLQPIIDDFELFDANWRDPNFSGSTNGDTDGDSTFTQSSAQAFSGSFSAALFYDFESSTGRIREYFDASGEEGRAWFGPAATISVELYGDNSGNEFRFAIRDGDGEIEGSDPVTINWSGWQTVSWDLGNDNVNGILSSGDGVVDGDSIKIDSLILLKTSGGTASSTIYFDELAYTPGEDIVTVGASGADFTDIQTAIDSFGADNGQANVVELIDSSYTVPSQLLVRKNSGDLDALKIRPAVDTTLILPQVAGDAGILMTADGLVEIGSPSAQMTLLPDTASGTGDNDTTAVILDEDTDKYYAWVNNLLIAPNDGSDNPSSDGTTAPNAGADTQFGGGLQTYSGPGFNYGNNTFLTDVTVTGTGGGSGSNRDGFEFYNDGDLGTTVREGVRSSHNAGAGVYFNFRRGRLLGTESNPILIHNNGGNGIWLAGGGTVFELENVASVENGGYGLYVNSVSSLSDSRIIHSVFAQNANSNIFFEDGDVLNVSIERSTVHDAGGSGDAALISAAATDTALTMTDSIVTGNGTTGPSDALNISTSSTNGTIALDYSAKVLNGPDALLGPDGTFGKTGSITETNTINDDPQYKSETFNAGQNPDYLVVTNPAYENQDSNGQDLGGWGGVDFSTGVDAWLLLDD